MLINDIRMPGIGQSLGRQATGTFRNSILIELSHHVTRRVMPAAGRLSVDLADRVLGPSSDADGRALVMAVVWIAVSVAAFAVARLIDGCS
jgi:hypothetical protein